MAVDPPTGELRTDARAALRRRAEGLSSAMQRFLEEQGGALDVAARLIGRALSSGGTLFLCGNGGSAAHALHLEAELLGRFDRERRPMPSVYLGAGASTSTAIANDYGAEHVFARPLQALARDGDALLALSTSGTSPNVLRALEVGRELGLATVLLSGPRGPDVAGVVLRYPAEGADRIQEGHQLIVHALMDAIEESL